MIRAVTARPTGQGKQYAVMCVIEQESGISSAGLARAAFVTPQTMTGILGNLDRNGLLSREADPSDPIDTSLVILRRIFLV